MAVQAGLRTRHITSVAITTACRNAIHLERFVRLRQIGLPNSFSNFEV